MNKSRYDIGLNFREIYGEVGLQVIKDLNAISHDMSKFILEFAFGDIYERNE